MHRRRFLTAVTGTAAFALAGCLGGSDGTVFDISPGSESLLAEAEIDLDEGDYELRVTFERFDPAGDGIDEEYVRGAVATADHTDTIAEVEITAEGTTSTTSFTIEDEDTYVGSVTAPTTESEARATLVSL